MVGQLADDRDQTQQVKEEIQRRCAQLTQQIEALGGLRKEFDARQAQWQELQQRAAQQQEALAEQVRGQQDDLSRRFLEFADRQEQVDAAEANLRQQQRAFDLVRAEHAAEAGQLAALRNRLEAKQAELETRAERLAERESETEAQRRRIAQDFRAQRAVQAARAAAGGGAAAGSQGEGEDFRRRYEMALEDLRELKARNADLGQQLAKGRPAAAPPAPAPSGVLNWETEKQRILAALESDAGKDSDAQQEERLTIEEVLRQTDQLLAEKDREIADLKQLLQDQSGSFGALALGAAAVGEILAQDAIVQEEREKLKRLQEEWREKLCQAEVDISLERAKIARERAQIEDKLRLLESQTANASEKVEDPSKTGKPVRGRWLSRLGLKDLDEGKK